MEGDDQQSQIIRGLSQRISQRRTPVQAMRFDAAFLAACERGDVRYVTEALTQIADGLRTHEITEALKRAAKGERRDIINLLAPVAPSDAVRGAVIAATGYGSNVALAALLDTPGAADLAGADLHMALQSAVMKALDTAESRAAVDSNPQVRRDRVAAVTLLLERGAAVETDNVSLLRHVMFEAQYQRLLNDGERDRQEMAFLLFDLLLDGGGDANWVRKGRPSPTLAGPHAGGFTAVNYTLPGPHAAWFTLLDYACRRRDSEEFDPRLAASLIDHGADVNRMIGGRTCLLEAIAEGNFDVVQFLLGRGTNLIRVIHKLPELCCRDGRHVPPGTWHPEMRALFAPHVRSHVDGLLLEWLEHLGKELDRGHLTWLTPCVCEYCCF